MTRNYPAKTHSAQGYSLIELMISVAISAFFLTVATSFLLGARTAHSTQDASSRVQENARFALDEITHMIRMAGHVDMLSPGAKIPQGQFYTGTCGGFDPCTANGVGTQADRIAVLLNPPPDDGTDPDCIGNPISANATVAAESVVANLYLVADDVDGISSLQCQSFIIDADGIATAINATPQVLVSGIDNLQIMYGITDIQKAGDIDTNLERYVSADTINGLTPPEGASSSWVDIKAVRVALLASSGTQDRSSGAASQTYSLFDADDIVVSDRAKRQSFSTTVMINNARD